MHCTRLLAAVLALGLAASSSAQELRYRLAPECARMPAGWHMGEAAGVAHDSAGHIYVFNRGAHPLLEFDANGAFLREIGEGVFVSAHSVRIDPQRNIWAVDHNGHMVVKFSPEGRVLMVLGRKGFSGDAPDMFNRPTDVAFAANGDVYVSDGYGNSRVVKYSSDGRVLKVWGKRGTGPGEFNTPHSVIVDRRGRLYVADRENRRIQIFDANETFIAEWKQAGSPWGLDITPDQHIYVIDGYASRVTKLDSDGRVLGSFGTAGRGPGQFAAAHLLSVMPDGVLYIAEVLNWRVEKFIPE